MFFAEIYPFSKGIPAFLAGIFPKEAFFQFSTVNWYNWTEEINLPWIRIRIHSRKPDPDPPFPQGGSEDPDPLFPNVDPRIRIRIHVKMKWIRNAARQIINETKRLQSRSSHSIVKCRYLIKKTFYHCINL